LFFVKKCFVCSKVSQTPQQPIATAHCQNSIIVATGTGVMLLLLRWFAPGNRVQGPSTVQHGQLQLFGPRVPEEEKQKMFLFIFKV
jgi:hypothetical protein